MRPWALAAVLFLVAACGSSPAPVPPPITPPPPPRPIAVSPPPISIPPPPATPRDQCGAWELQGLVGRPRSEIPVAADLSRRRVVCSSCPMTMDYRPDRLTIEYDAATNRVTKVICG